MKIKQDLKRLIVGGVILVLFASSSYANETATANVLRTNNLLNISTNILTLFSLGDINFNIESSFHDGDSLVYGGHVSSEKIDNMGKFGAYVGYRTYLDIVSSPIDNAVDYLQGTIGLNKGTTDNEDGIVPSVEIWYGFQSTLSNKLFTEVSVGIQRTFYEGSKVVPSIGWNLGLML
jgi:hypothetical protein